MYRAANWAEVPGDRHAVGANASITERAKLLAVFVVDSTETKLVTDDKEFYGAISVSVTEARKVLPEKKLATIMTVTPAKPGEETVRVVTRGS